MKRILLAVCASALCVVALQAQMRGDKTRLLDNDEESVERRENEWLEAFFARGAGVLEEALADDFTAGGGALSRAEFIGAAEAFAALYGAATIEDRRVRLYGDMAVSTGRILLRRRETAGPIKGKRGTPSASAVANAAELARQEATKAPSQSEGRLGGINPPAPEGDSPTTERTPVQYRYTAVYIRRARRWQAVALQTTRVASGADR